MHDFSTSYKPREIPESRYFLPSPIAEPCMPPSPPHPSPMPIILPDVRKSLSYIYGRDAATINAPALRTTIPFEDQQTMQEDKADRYNQEGERLFTRKDILKAKELFKKAITANPTHVLAHNNLGVVYNYSKRRDKALEYFRKALEIDPQNRTTLDNLSELLQSMKTENEQFATANFPEPKQPAEIPGKQANGFIFCNGMPRSGSTWSFNVCRELLQSTFGQKKVVATYVGEGSQLDNYLSIHNEDDKIHILKFPYPTPLMSKMMKQGRAKNIYTMRHPLAALASFKETFNPPFESAVKSIQASLKAADKWRNDPGTLFVEFDTIFSNPREEILRIATHLDLEANGPLIDRITEKTSFDITRKIVQDLAQKPKEQLIQAGNSYYDPKTLLHLDHLPKGQARDWRSELTMEEQEFARQELAPWLAYWQEDVEQQKEKKENDGDDLLRQINSFPFWYHKITLPGGIVTPGWAPLNPAAYRIPADLTGKRVLDVGSWDGYWTFDALKRGAKEVIAIDDFSDYLGKLEKRDRKAWQTFDFCKKALGYSDERCKRVEMSIYKLQEDTFGHFDVIFFFGTLYHLRYPLMALDILSAVCNGEIYVESAILDDFSPYRGGLGKGYGDNQMVMEFYPGKEYGNNDSNWWAPTLYCLVNMVAAAGFTDCRGWKLTDIPQELPHCRGFAHGKKDNTSPLAAKEALDAIQIDEDGDMPEAASGQRSSSDSQRPKPSVNLKYLNDGLCE